MKSIYNKSFIYIILTVLLLILFPVKEARSLNLNCESAIINDDRFLNENEKFTTFKNCIKSKNFSKAEKLCISGGASDCSNFTYRVSRELMDGDKKDIQQATQLLFYSAVKGHSQAQKQLGIMFSMGTNVPLSPMRAHAFLMLAKENGETEIDFILDAIKPHLNAEKRIKAEQYKDLLINRKDVTLSRLGDFRDVKKLSNAEKALIKRKVLMCSLVANAVKEISKERDSGVDSKTGIKTGLKTVTKNLKNPTEEVSKSMEKTLTNMSVLVYLAKHVKPDTLRLYTFAHCVSSISKREMAQINVSRLHEVIAGLEKCQAQPGLSDTKAFGSCLKRHVMPHVGKK